MSNQKVVCVNELTIRFEQMENENSVNWTIIPDEKVQKTLELSLMDLAECGAPLSALGIRELYKLCGDGLMFTALETANSTMNGINQRIALRHADHSQDRDLLESSVH